MTAVRQRGMTWRKLHWAAMAKRRDEWDRFSNLMSFVAASGFGGKFIDPKLLNPLYEDKPESPAAREIRTKMAFDSLEAGLRLMAGQRIGD